MDDLDEGTRRKGAHQGHRGTRSSRSGKVVKAHKAVTDGPFAEAKDLIGGYTLVQAKDLAQAADLTSGCPIFEIGGFVEVRPIRAM